MMVFVVRLAHINLSIRNRKPETFTLMLHAAQLLDELPTLVQAHHHASDPLCVGFVVSRAMLLPCGTQAR